MPFLILCVAIIVLPASGTDRLLLVQHCMMWVDPFEGPAETPPKRQSEAGHFMMGQHQGCLILILCYIRYTIF